MGTFVSLRALVCATTLSLLPLAVFAQANDNWANRTPIALPFTVLETSMPSASLEVTDPDPPCRQVFQSPISKTLWYGFTTGGSPVYLNLEVTDYDVAANITVYSGAPGSFRIVSGACAISSFPPNFNAELRGVRLAPNTSFSIMVSDGFALNPSDELAFSVTAAPLYQVTKTADTLDGTCDADCSLREAIGASNLAPGAVLIPQGTYTQTRLGSAENLNFNGDFDLLRSMGIYGAGMALTIIDADLLDRGMDLPQVLENDGLNRSFALGDFSVNHGRAGGAAHGGGIRMESNGGDYFGLERVAIIDGQAQLGGGLYLTCPGTIRDSRFSANSAQFGGGLEFGYDESRPLEISGSTFDDNYADTSGGGAYLGGGVKIVNSTFSGNHADYTGGGIQGARATLGLFSNTIVFNSAGDNPNQTTKGGGLHLDGAGDATNVLANNIIAGNTAASLDDEPDCALFDDATMSTHHNHVQRNMNCTFAGAGDVVGTDPGVAPTLMNIGGLTLVHPLLVGSVAINAGDPAGCKDAAGLTLAFDQRGAGFPRVLGPACDKGAVEEVPKIGQTITNFASTPISPAYLAGSQFSVSATPGGSGNPVVYASSSTGVCTVVSNTVTIVTAGTCVLTANQAGNGSYYAAPQVTLNVTITKANQAITNFASSPTSPVYSPSGTFSVSATSGASSSSVVFSSGTTGVCTVSGSTVTIVTAGNCELRANEAADTNYNAAPQVTLPVTITKANQTITNFASSPTSPVYSPGGTFSVSATSGASSNAVVFSSSTTGVCTVAGSTVTIVTVGNCELRANEAADSNYNVAPQETLTVSIAKANQAITGFASNPTSPVFTTGGTFTVSANSGASSNAVVITSASTGICTVSGSTVTIVTAGNCELRANEAADANYNAAPQVTLNVTIAKASQAITNFVATPTAPVFSAGGTFSVSATAGASGSPLVFASTSTGVCTVSGTTVTMLTVGECALTVNQAADTNYNEAAQLTLNVSLGGAGPLLVDGFEGP